ncbi:MAG: FkbM family methyltransferase [Verrucomicrobia subdivision 3 bacterium]|nr:FkbM family methyltransferase [Limisphaerales bacterium]
MGFYELCLTRSVANLARNGGVLVDVGANIGYFSCLWAGLNSGNIAYAFEPSARNFSMLERNIRAQPFRDSIRASSTALGRETGELHFDPGPAEQSGWGGLAGTPSADAVRVKVERLDNIMRTTEQIAVLKIDTEGADAWVLEGAACLLRNKRVRHVFCERNVTRMKALGIPDDAIEQFLNRVGYKVTYIDGSKRGEIHAVAKSY